VNNESIQGLLRVTATELFLIVGPILFFFLILGFLSTYIQVGGTFSWEKTKPKLNKISPLAGIKRLISPRSLVEFAKGLVKLVLVGLVLFFVALPLLSDIELFPGFDLFTSFKRIQEIAVILVFWTIAIMSIVAALDFAYQKHDHIKKLRMTKQEVKDEHKNLEGDPKVKARLAQIRQERQRARMIANVTEADIVITNPTHYAVALKYDINTMPAPILVAKGVDELALRMRDVADENEVPIVENPPLARALYAAVELNESIPEHLYNAVAEVIGYVFRLTGKLPSDGPIHPPKPDWSIDPGYSDEGGLTEVRH
jgi:flagellar biosynthetic protein FlhB